MPPSPSSPPSPPWVHRLLCLVYETLLIVTLMFLLMVAPMTVWTFYRGAPPPSWILWLWTLALLALYFIWHWSHGGQTLASKTWKMAVVAEDGTPLTPSRAAVRFVLALLLMLPCGLSLWWALFDRQGQALHDRLAHCRLIRSSG